MSTKKVHIHNTSGSNLELATIGTMMDRNMISYESYDADKLAESSEIQKFVSNGFIKLLTPQEAAAARVAKAEDKESNPESVADLEMETPPLLHQAQQKLSEGLSLLQKAMANANSGPMVDGRSVKKNPVKTTVAGSPAFNIVDDGQSINVTQDKEPRTVEASGEDDEFPKLPPPGIMPRNEPVKKFLGKPPYSQPMGEKEQLAYLKECLDITILQEIAMLALPGRVRDLARKKVREVRSSLAGIQA